MERVFLAGTTTGTTWRSEVIERLLARGVREDQIVNPHLPRGVHYTAEHMQFERECKRDPHTIVLIFVCPAVVEDAQLDAESLRRKREMLGPISMFEIGKFAYSQPHRTAIVLDSQSFQEGARPRKVMEGLSYEVWEDFGGNPPYFPSLAAAEDWIVSQLV